MAEQWQAGTCCRERFIQSTFPNDSNLTSTHIQYLVWTITNTWQFGSHNCLFLIWPYVHISR